MKALLVCFLACGILFQGGCFTNAVITESKKYKSADFYPDAIWRNEATATFAILGKRNTAKSTVRCHVLIPDAVLAKVKNAEGEVRLSDLRNLPYDEVQRLKLVDGPPPAGFVELSADPSSQVVLYRGKNVLQPGRLLLLPFAIVIDVVTLPIAIPLLASLSGIN